ncbi:MAG: alanine racemase [Candidatus Zixiibacteriota bacterium]
MPEFFADRVNELDTPALLIEKNILEQNINRMQQTADRYGVSLRPHIKAHKMPFIALRQIKAGAVGVAAAKLGEVEVMVDYDVADILVANEIIGRRKIERLYKLSRKARLSCAVDALENAREISEYFVSKNHRIDVLIEVDSGLHRCGLSSFDDIVTLARGLRQLQGIRCRGIVTHAGHAYAAKTAAEVAAIGEQEGRLMVDIAVRLRRLGFEPEVVSVGSTPTAPFAVQIPGVTELRPGNYVFNDMIQVALGVAPVEACALTVLASVISLPAPGRAVIDAGSKVLSLDRGAHGNELVSGYGRIIGKNARLERLSEEHGIVSYENEQFTLGEKIRIIPNHACPVVNLFNYACLVDRQHIEDVVEIEGRGKVT